MDKVPLYDIHGLKCDHCDYTKDDVPYEEYPEWIGVPCPVCGNSLLTQKDYNATKSIVHVITKVERIFGNKLAQIILGRGKYTRINFHGNGFSDAEFTEEKHII